MINLKRAPKNRFVRITAIAINILLTVATLISAYGGMMEPSTCTLGALALMCLPIIIFLDLVVLAINIFIFRPLAVLNILTLICCIGPIYTYAPINFNSAKEDNETSTHSPDSFKLLTYNAFQFNYYDSSYTPDERNRSISYIDSVNPDIVVLQEANALSRLSRWRFDREQVTNFVERYPYRFLSEKNGLAILSRYPVEEVAVDKRSFEGSMTSDFVCYHLEVEGHPLHIFNVHLQSIGLTPADKELYRALMRANLDPTKFSAIKDNLIGKLRNAFSQRAVQARALRNAIDSVAGGGNVIVCGDFNDVPSSYATRTVEGRDLHNAFTRAGNGISITYYPNFFYFRIDHIFYGGDLEAVDVKRGNLRASDHYPLVATFRWL